MRTILQMALLGVILAGCQTSPENVTYKAGYGAWGDYQAAAGGMSGYQLTSPDFAVPQTDVRYQPPLDGFNAPSWGHYTPETSTWSAPQSPSYKAAGDEYELPSLNYKKKQPLDGSTPAPMPVKP